MHKTLQIEISNIKLEIGVLNFLTNKAFLGICDWSMICMGVQSPLHNFVFFKKAKLQRSLTGLEEGSDLCEYSPRDV